MKKSIFNTLGAIGIMALIALNVYVVTSKETPAFLKWDAMSYIFAKGNSGSGSGSGNSTTCSASASCITPSGKTLGSVSCSGKNTCVSGYKYVTCDGNTSYCDI